MNNIIDLTYEIEEGMTTFGAYWHIPVKITQLGRHETEGRETRKLEMSTHTGTHVDSPLHFIKGGKSIDKISLYKLIGPVTIVDYSHLNKNEMVTEEMLSKIQITPRMLFKFGWGKNWKTDKFYKDYPFFSTEAAEYLVGQGVELLAMDIPSPDDSRINIPEVICTDKDSPVHKIILSNNIVMVEYVANLDKVSELTGWNIAVLPLKVKGSDGSPARVCIYK
ncbi:cyclase family protein [Candidatus Woesearchaeota archaeon]|nr:cyclase family protein [Candidatus Woesearchaeota archaeon]